ncbi:hypothetical protein BS50DRAFT_410010 [Corynespora cassiicola Philippines]|uniref:Uncharacterized protein n=1 Tax=Corynespora cassiicola Philippines TaxID=1448308 RepID=A0A2T2NLB0_CORCC|nr:hypothetical protein BS50DRAFT_410010 [Corynespora cassiicola Philippines]
MAEVVGVFAAVVQLVDVTARLSSTVNRFCSDVRNLPDRLHLLKEDVRQQAEIARNVQAHCVPAFAVTLSSPTFDAILHEYIAVADELCKKLDELLSKKGHDIIRRAWNVICSKQQREDVLEQCERLEKQKTMLSMWLNANNLRVSLSTETTTAHIKKLSEEVLALSKANNDISSRAADGTDQLALQIETVDRDSSARDHQLFEAVRHMTGQLDLILAEQSLIAQRRANISVSSQPDPYLTIPTTRRDLIINSNDSIKRHQKCTCRTINRTSHWRPLSVVHLTKTSKVDHFSYCPEYRNSKKSSSITVHLVPPAWAASNMISLAFRMESWKANGNFSISPMVIGTSRLVDRETSPAFRAIEDTLEPYRYGSLYNIPDAPWKNLQITLQTLFNDQRASVLDTDRNGCTLLVEVISIYFHNIHGQERRFQECLDLIQYLLDEGANPNAQYTYLDPKVAPGTSLDHFGSIISILNKYGEVSSNRYINVIYKKLEASGCESTRPMAPEFETLANYPFNYEVNRFKLFEEQIDLCGHGPLVSIILRQDEKLFSRAVHKSDLADLNQSSPIDGLTVVHFATTWPTGLNILIKKGVNLDSEDSYRRRPIHLAISLECVDAVRLLVQADCALRGYGNGSLLYQILEKEDDFVQQVFDLVVHALICRYSRLLSMAQEYLPFSKLSNLNIEEGSIRELHVSQLNDLFISHGIDVPCSLELDGQDKDTFMYYRMSLQSANVLWDAGFHYVNEINEYGLTPFIQACCYGGFKIASWFLEKGVPVTSRHRNTPLTALHFLAYGFTQRNCKDSLDEAESKFLRNVEENLGIHHDHCACLCSPDGCSPVKFLLDKNIRRRTDESLQDRFQNWLKAVHPDRFSRQYVMAFTRILIFDFLGGEHTCCSIGGVYISRVESIDVNFEVKPSHKRTFRKLEGKSRFDQEYCKVGLPIPWNEVPFPEGPDKLAIVLDEAMSHFDEMPPSENIPAYEKPFEYLRWILAEGYLKMDLSYDGNCRWKKEYEREKAAQLALEDAG